tara:strand:- start:35 stop:1609 length:1575 start_codon:yes stop_codon:yes gene_type:complete
MAYTVTADSLFSTHSGRIEEVINKNIGTILPSMDPAWRDTIVSSQGVGPASEIGRDMLITKVFMGSMAGVVQMSNKATTNDFTLFGDTNTSLGSKMHLQNITQTFPDAADGPNATPYRLQVPMRAIHTNLMMTMGELQAEATPAFIGSVIAPKMEGFARNIAQTVCNTWYTTENDNYVLGTIAGKSTTGTGDGHPTNSVKVTLNEKTYHRFAVGMRVDVQDETESAGSHTDDLDADMIGLYVVAVDEVKGEIVLASASGSADALHGALTVGAAGTGDRIVLPGFRKSGDTDKSADGAIAGINSWLKSSGKLLGNDAIASAQIDVGTHPEHKSYTKGSVGALTEHKLRQYLRGFHRAKDRYGMYIDCLIASDGVWLDYESQKIGQYMVDRTGKPSSMNSQGSVDGFTFMMDGRTYQGYTSNYVEDGAVYGIRKGGNNWKRYVPPSPAGTQKASEVESFLPFEFVAPALGYAGIKAPIATTAGGAGDRTTVTEGVQLPGMLRMQLVPDQPAGLKLTGCNTDTIYGD